MTCPKSRQFEGSGDTGGAVGHALAAGEVEPEDALMEAFIHRGPALVDVATTRQTLALPPTITYGQLTGFTLHATRTILSGGGGELLELARQPQRTRPRVTLQRLIRTPR